MNDVEAVTLLAETAKLIGNSVYGKMLTNQERHREIKYANSNRKALNYIKADRDIDMEEMAHDSYEMSLEKAEVICFFSIKYLHLILITDSLVLQYISTLIYLFLSHCRQQYKLSTLLG